MISILNFVSSLAFLYLFAIVLLIWLGYKRRYFPWVFTLITAGCIFFLYRNMHASLKMHAYSNLDHHFIRHDGFRVGGTITLNKSFVLTRQNGELKVYSPYAEEPFFILKDGKYKLVSPNYTAEKTPLQFQADNTKFQIIHADGQFELKAENELIGHSSKQINKGMNGWNIFRDDTSFMNSSWYTNEKLAGSLRNIYLIKDEELKYFISGKITAFSEDIQYQNHRLDSASQVFTVSIPERSAIGWGLGVWDNSKNLFNVSYRAADSFDLVNRYPLSYPLTEEKKADDKEWTSHRVDKFLVSDTKDLVAMPAVFTEGFLFPSNDSSMNFSPVLLSYNKGSATAPLNINGFKEDQMLVKAKTGNFSWLFSIQDSYNWKLGSIQMKPIQWQAWIFGVLLLFFGAVMVNALFRSADKLSWIWQLLSCVTIVMLTTRFFLYWRYKSFPPFESLDAPSLQQLNSFWNFGVIIAAGLLLSLVFGLVMVKRKFSLAFPKISFIKKIQPRALFITGWIIVLLSGAILAFVADFDPAICRHLAIGLVLFYFLFIYISYRHSPLVVSADKKWWDIHTGKAIDIIFNNPVKVLLSVSLLGLFAFIDMGFAIVFLNFILFNEAFLCINFAIAGLSAGSRNNAKLFAWMGGSYMLGFAINLAAGPYIFKFLLEMPPAMYWAACILFSLVVAYAITRIISRNKLRIGIALSVMLSASIIFLFPQQKIIDKAAITKYRIDVMTVPVDKAIENAYSDGRTWEPVIRAAQNQWFINTFIYEKNNPEVNATGFHLLPHSPQNKGAKYNAQATDLVTSRFLIAEHGRWPVLFYVLLLIIPSILLASFYKLYPDFTNRINDKYPVITTGFSLLNYLLVTALLVILAATGRYIFFGQDLPFGSILSKQSILFPSAILITLVFLFRPIAPEQYQNRKKFLPGAIVFSGLAILIFFVRPAFNKNKEFNVPDLAKDMDNYIQLRLQPVMDEIDSTEGKLSIAKRDKIFTQRIKTLLGSGAFSDAGSFLQKQIAIYTQQVFSKHMDESSILYLDLHSGKPELAVNENYFRVEPPPHLQQLWAGNIYGDSSNYNITVWDAVNGELISKRINGFADEPFTEITGGINFIYNGPSIAILQDTIRVTNPGRWILKDDQGHEKIISIQPDVFMKNLYVNGARYYTYPLGSDFIWARNFSETIARNFSEKEKTNKNVFISLDAELTDSLVTGIKRMMNSDSSYHSLAEYGICIADGNGRLLAIPDWIKGLDRPDPNDKAAFYAAMKGENGMISQSQLRKLAGNINLLRMNPGPGSTLKPIIFSAIASQLPLNWEAFASEGFSQKLEYFGGEKVAEYDFEKNNGRINNVADYLKYSDNYYHSDILLLGSYNRQSLQDLLFKHFEKKNPEQGIHWPYFSYNGQNYWLNGFENWPGYANGKANFGSDSSFVSIGLFNNYGICTAKKEMGCDRYATSYDSMILQDAWRRSGFILPEFSLFDQKGGGMNMSRPNEVFLSSFRGHVKGSSQVMIPPVKMLDAFGKLASQNRNYSLTLDPYATAKDISPFYVDNGVKYKTYLELIKASVFGGMREALFRGTAAKLGTMIKNGSPYFYFAKTGTTGNEESKAKSKLFVLIISEKDISSPDFNFRKNKFITIYFTSQKGPADQNELFQKEVIRIIENSAAFRKYFNSSPPL